MNVVYLDVDLIELLQARPEESLTAVAVRYNTTPSELRRLNRLMSDMIHPGQVALVISQRASSMIQC